MKKLLDKEILLYIVFGGLTTAVYFFVRFLVIYLSSNSILAVILAQISAILFAYITNKIYVFQDNEWKPILVIKQFISFFIGRLVVFFLDIVITFIAVVQFSDFFIKILSLEKVNYEHLIFNSKLTENFVGNPQLLNEFIFAMLIQVIAIILNYLISKMIVFKTKKNP